MVALASFFSAFVHVGIAVFQLMLVAGKPWGEYAWGGQNKGVLPVGYRIGSAISLCVLLAFAAINLFAGGFFPLPALGISVKTLQWVVTGYAALGSVMNAISRSQKERNLWTPVVTVLAVLNAIVLWSLY